MGKQTNTQDQTVIQRYNLHVNTDMIKKARQINTVRQGATIGSQKHRIASDYNSLHDDDQNDHRNAGRHHQKTPDTDCGQIICLWIEAGLELTEDKEKKKK